VANVGRKPQFPITNKVAYLRSLVKLLIKNARIIEPGNPLNGQRMDLLVHDGRIDQIAPSLSLTADKIIEADDLHVSPGWVDIFAHFGEPGYEEKETIESGSNAALAGGYTDVFLVPNNTPVTDDKSGVEYLKQSARNNPVQIHPIGAITKSTEGKELAELYDMHRSGAVAFSDGTKSIQAAGLLLKALQYVKAIQAPIIQLPDDRSIQPQGLMHEGITSTQIGLPGRPDISESIQANRDIVLNKYTDSNLHLTGISSAATVDCIRNGKKEQAGLTCSVTAHHLMFSEEDMMGYNTLLKSNPPFRTQSDRQALIHAIHDGVIDCLASHHFPHEPDRKVCEFEQASNGMIGLETTFAIVRTAMPDLPLDKIIALIACNPRKIFALPNATIASGEIACLTLFDPNREWLVEESSLRSRSKNSPVLGKVLKGKAIGTVLHGNFQTA
jgi:dihydroorotase